MKGAQSKHDKKIKSKIPDLNLENKPIAYESEAHIGDALYELLKPERIQLEFGRMEHSIGDMFQKYYLE